MDLVKRTVEVAKNGVRKTVEWRSPATGLYLMLVNAAFWSAVIYCDEPVQEKMLVSSAAGIFAWDVLLSPSHERSIIAHILFWPVKSIWRTVAVFSSLFSVHAMRGNQLDVACWAAYSTLVCVLINPVWEYNEVNSHLYNVSAKVINFLCSAAKAAVVKPAMFVYSWAKYILLFQFVPPLIELFKSWANRIISALSSLTASFRDWINEAIIQRFKRVCHGIYVWLRYWFCAEWWPAFKCWLSTNVGKPMRRLFDYICYGIVYVVCGYWVPPLSRWLMHKLGLLAGYLNVTVLQPFKRLMQQQFERFRGWLRNVLHIIAVAIRDSVLWPICLLVVDATKSFCALCYAVLIHPVLAYLHDRYKVVETKVLIYFLGPICKQIVEHIPEKNPLCDDSDVELEGFLPEGMSAEDDGECTSTTNSAAPSPIPEEEHEFEAGLKFPAIIASESSDDEFDLPKKRTEKRKKRRDIFQEQGVSSE